MHVGKILNQVPGFEKASFVCEILKTPSIFVCEYQDCPYLFFGFNGSSWTGVKTTYHQIGKIIRCESPMDEAYFDIEKVLVIEIKDKKINGNFVPVSDVPQIFIPREEVFLDEIGFDIYLDEYREIREYLLEKESEEDIGSYASIPITDMIKNIRHNVEQKKIADMIEEIKAETRAGREEFEDYDDLEDNYDGDYDERKRQYDNYY